MSEQRKSYLTKSLFLAVAVILIAIVAHQPGYPSITRQIEKRPSLWKRRAVLCQILPRRPRNFGGVFQPGKNGDRRVFVD